MKIINQVKSVEKCWCQPQTKAFSFALVKKHGLMLNTCAFFVTVSSFCPSSYLQDDGERDIYRRNRTAVQVSLTNDSVLALQCRAKRVYFYWNKSPVHDLLVLSCPPYLLINKYGHFDVCSKVVTHDAPWKEQCRPFRVRPQQPEHRGEHEEQEQVSPTPINHVSHLGGPHWWQTVGVRRLKRHSDVLGNGFV